MERKRSADSVDRLRWYCSKGEHATPTVIREEAFHCEDLGEQLKSLIETWRENAELRRCGECGGVADPQ